MSTNGAKDPYGALGSPLPALTPHAISVSFPTWKDNVDYEEGAPRVIDVQKNGYPRFFIHLSIDKVHCTLAIELDISLIKLRGISSSSYGYVNNASALKARGVCYSLPKRRPSDVALLCKIRLANRDIPTL